MKHSTAWPRSEARCFVLGLARSFGYDRGTAS
jgi:hypothetical protein